jgi:glycosyltransferase involved in cell wall biosynthesis
MLEPDVSFVIPAYNEGKVIASSLARLVRVLSKFDLRYEIIVVDDGSTDDTRDEVISFAQRHQLTLIGYGKNMGKGYALKRGVVHSGGAKIVFLDADLDVQLNNLNDYLSALDRSDVAIGSKRHLESQVTGPRIRMFFSNWFNILVRLLTGLKFLDTQAGLKAVKKQVVSPLLLSMETNRYGFDVELLILANLHRLRISELPIDVKMNRLMGLSEMWASLLDLLRIAYRLRIAKSFGQFVEWNVQRYATPASKNEQGSQNSCYVGLRKADSTVT